MICLCFYFLPSFSRGFVCPVLLYPQNLEYICHPLGTKQMLFAYVAAHQDKMAR